MARPVALPSPATHSSPVSRRTAFALLGILVVVWGLHWPIVKFALRDIPPLTYAFLRVLTAMLTVAAILGARRRLVRPPRADLRVLIVVGLVQVAAAVTLMNLGLMFVPAGRSSILAYTIPFWAAIVQAVALGRLVGRGRGGARFGHGLAGAWVGYGRVVTQSRQFLRGRRHAAQSGAGGNRSRQQSRPVAGGRRPDGPLGGRCGTAV